MSGPREWLDRLRILSDAATQGPWETVPTVGHAVVSADGDGSWTDVADRIETEADAEFIAHARADVPRLLDFAEAVVRLADEAPTLPVHAGGKPVVNSRDIRALADEHLGGER